MFGVRPQDELLLLDLPVQIQVACAPGGQQTPLVAFDPDRVVLMLGIVAGGPIVFGLVANDPTVGVFSLSKTGGYPVILSREEHGPMVCQAWNVSATAAASVAGSLSMSLTRPPEIYGYDLFNRAKPVKEYRGYVPHKIRRPAPKPLSVPARVLGELGRLCPRLLGGG